MKKTQPFHPLLVDFYRAYHLAKDDIPQLLALLGQAQKNETDPETRIRYGIEMATVAERRPQLLEKAIDAWKLLLRIRPGLPEAVGALRRLYTKAEKWNQLLDLLKDQCEALPAAEVDQKVECYLDMVPIYRDRLKLETMVLNTYAAVLALRPDHQEALLALAERYQAQSRWGDLAGVLARQAMATADPAERVVLYHRIASLWIEKFGNHHNAIAALERILEIDPKDAKARGMLREIYTRGRSWRALLELLRRELPHLEPEARRAHLAEMAVLAAERLADLRQAIGLWNEVLELAPTDRPAAAALVGALRAREALAGAGRDPGPPGRVGGRRGQPRRLRLARAPWPHPAREARGGARRPRHPAARARRAARESARAARLARGVLAGRRHRRARIAVRDPQRLGRSVRRARGPGRAHGRHERCASAPSSAWRTSRAIGSVRPSG